MKLELLTNATVVDDAIKFVTSNANVNSNSNIRGTQIHSHAQSNALGQGQEVDKATVVKPQTDASILDSTHKASGIREETEHLLGGATTTNTVF
jgi:hypothetical protein